MASNSEFVDYSLPPINADGSSDPLYPDITTGTDNGGSDSGGDIGGIINGIGQLTQLFDALPKIIPVIVKAITLESAQPLIDTLTHITDWVKHADKVFDARSIATWEWLSGIFPTSLLYKEMLSLGLGVNVDEFDADAQQGVKTVDTMLGFALAMPIIAGAVSAIGKPILANRWGEGIDEAIRKIPEEMGLSWALGLQIDEAVKTAIGRSIEEGINKQKRPNRLEWPVLRTMVKQHVLNASEFKELLENQGFPDKQISMIEQLLDQFLPIGDLQAMYLAGIMSDSDIETYIRKLGFTDSDTSKLMDLYVHKADTAAGATYRAVARSLFVNRLIDSGEYRSILTKTNFPEKEIEWDVAAIELEHSTGRLKGSESTVRQQFTHGLIEQSSAVSALIQIGFAPDFASATVAGWAAPPASRKRHLSQSTILSYLVSNIIDRGTALQKLLDIGLSPDDAAFLVQHPRATPAVLTRKRTPSVVIQAYLDGVIDIGQLPELLRSAGVADNDLGMWEGIAKYRLSHQKHKPEGTLPLDRAQILAAYKYGIFDLPTAETYLTQLGYSIENAVVLLEIEAHGVFKAAEPPAFASVDAAASFLRSLGYTLVPPLDPRIVAAEVIVEQAGFGVIPPAPVTPPEG